MTPSPRPQAAAPRRVAGDLGALMPAGALLLGLSVVAVIVASQPRLSPARLGDKAGTLFGLYPVGGRQEVFHHLPLSPFSDDLAHRPWLLTLALTAIYLSSTTAIGHVLADRIRGEDRWPRSIATVAGFLPGYLMLLAPLQLLFATVPVQPASWIALAAMPIGAVALHWQRCAAVVTTTLRDRHVASTPVLTACGIVGMVVLAIVHRLQVGPFFLTQDSVQWLLAGAKRQLDGEWGQYLVQWNLQTDEWLFNAPLMLSSHNVGDLWFPIYATQCLSLVSFLALAYGIAHRLARARKRLAGALVAAVVFGSTPAIYPWRYAVIVAGGQPVVALGHPGRHIGIVAPWIAILMADRQRRPVTIALGLATLGLGFVTVHVLLDVLAAIAAMLIWQVVRGRAVTWSQLRGVRTGVSLLPIAVMGAMACAFGLLPRGPTVGAVWWLVLGGMLAIAGAIVIGLVTARQQGSPSASATAAWIGAWVAVAVAGMLLSNNLTGDLLHGGVRHALGTVLPGYDGPLLSRGGDDGNNLEVVSGLSFPRLSDSACASFIVCGGLASFLAAFGVLFVLVTVTWISFGPLTSDAVVNVRRATLLILLAGLALGLIIVFFTGAPSLAQAIIYSRFLEIPYYGLLALAAMTFAESRNRLTTIAGTAMLTVWTIVPLIATQWPEQIVRNASWYLQLLL